MYVYYVWTFSIGYNMWCWRRLLRVPWIAMRSNQSIFKESILNIHWKDWYWSGNSNTFATWCEELTHWIRPWLWERLKAGGEGENRRQHGWMTSLTQWTWVWVSFRRWETWCAVVHGIAKNWKWLGDWTTKNILSAERREKMQLISMRN